jgi:acyl-CoA thioesterase FadM
VLRNGWTPVVSAGQIRFRRELRPFQAFDLETRLLHWDTTRVVMEHRLIAAGTDTIAAIALVQAGLYDRKRRSFVPVHRLMEAIGVVAHSPQATPEVKAFLSAGDTLRRATASD